jgi:hypothetical protein
MTRPTCQVWRIWSICRWRWSFCARLCLLVWSNVLQDAAPGRRDQGGLVRGTDPPQAWLPAVGSRASSLPGELLSSANDHSIGP